MSPQVLAEPRRSGLQRFAQDPRRARVAWALEESCGALFGWSCFEGCCFLVCFFSWVSIEGFSYKVFPFFGWGGVSRFLFGDFLIPLAYI